LVKRYVDKHLISFTGEAKGTKISGKWSMDTTIGTFDLKEVPVDREVESSHKTVGLNQNYFGSYDDKNK